MRARIEIIPSYLPSRWETEWESYPLYINIYLDIEFPEAGDIYGTLPIASDIDTSRNKHKLIYLGIYSRQVIHKYEKWSFFSPYIRRFLSHYYWLLLMLRLNIMPYKSWAHEKNLVPPALTVWKSQGTSSSFQINLLEVLRITSLQQMWGLPRGRLQPADVGSNK